MNMMQMLNVMSSSLQARGGASRGLRQKSVRMPAQQASAASSQEDRPSKRQRH